MTITNNITLRLYCAATKITYITKVNPLPFNRSSTWVRILAGEGSAAGNNVDVDYVNGSGVGGVGPTYGNNGMAIIRPQTIATLKRMTSHTEGNDTELELELVIERRH